MELILSITALLVSLVVAILTYIKIKAIFINLYTLSKGLDTLFANDQKIIELTKIKGYIELVNEEKELVRKEVAEERSKLGDKKIKGVVRSPNSNSNS